MNKLDTTGWSKERFDEICSKLGAFLRQAGFKEQDVFYVPVSGLTGENLATPPKEAKLLEWYKGPTLLQAIGKTIINPDVNFTNSSGFRQVPRTGETAESSGSFGGE